MAAPRGSMVHGPKARFLHLPSVDAPPFPVQGAPA